MEAAIVVLGGVTAFAGIIAISSLINGWAFSVLWAWFIVPVFGAPPLSIPQAIGIALIVGVLFTRSGGNEKEGSAASRMFACWLSPLFLLGMGWIVKYFL
jgi:hypothetical protein